MNIAVIIPAYNEEVTIRDVILDFHRSMKEALICVIDNNSKDATNSIAKKTFEEFGIPGGVFFVKEQGKANAVRFAFQNIEADVYVMTDADLTYPAEAIHRLIEPIVRNEADMTVGDRHSAGHYKKENKRQFHNFGNWFVTAMIRALFRSDLVDIMSGYRAFSRKFVKNFPIMCRGFELETELSIHALDKRFRVVEIPVEYKDRPEGSFSKLSTFKDGIRVVTTIINIFRNYKPLFFFAFASLVCLCLGLGAGMMPILEFVHTGYVSRVPLTILAAALVIVSMLLLCVGLILDNIVRYHRTEYELRLNGYRKA